MELEHAQEENDLNFGIRQYYIYRYGTFQDL